MNFFFPQYSKCVYISMCKWQISCFAWCWSNKIIYKNTHLSFASNINTRSAYVAINQEEHKQITKWDIYRLRIYDDWSYCAWNRLLTNQSFDDFLTFIRMKLLDLSRWKHSYITPISLLSKLSSRVLIKAAFLGQSKE